MLNVLLIKLNKSEKIMSKKKSYYPYYPDFSKKTRQYCKICNGVVAPGDQQRILIKSEDKGLIHTHCLAHGVLNNGLKDKKMEVKHVFDPLFNYDNTKKNTRVFLEELLDDVKTAIATSALSGHIKNAITESLSVHCEKIEVKY